MTLCRRVYKEMCTKCEIFDKEDSTYNSQLCSGESGLLQYRIVLGYERCKSMNTKIVVVHKFEGYFSRYYTNISKQQNK